MLRYQSQVLEQRHYEMYNMNHKRLFVILPIIAILFGTTQTAFGQSTLPICGQSMINGPCTDSTTTNTTQTQTGFIGTDFGDLSNLASIPLIGGMIASHSKVTTILHNEQGVFLPWSFICNKGQSFILQSCSTLVNPDGSLTQAGDTAVGCIRNGIAAAVAAKQNNIPLGLLKGVLDFAAPLTGCGGIVNLDTIQNEPQFQSILNAITQ
jgi:hypothetical protein